MEAFTIVDQVSSCRREVNDLIRRNDVISVDAEGVNLGPEGPLTLLQVGRSDGHVLLFDIHVGGPEMFTDGRLKELLESDSVLKVMHGSSNDSTALHSQFGVELENVFDIQVAQMTVEEGEGRQLPSRMKLAALCSQYIEDMKFLENKDTIQFKWNKSDGEYWARRPMTAEMIDYACADIGMLIPVYHELNSKLDRLGWLASFKKKGDIDLRFRFDDDINTADRENQRKIINGIFQSMDTKYRGHVDIDLVQDKDEIQALKRTRMSKIGKYSKTIQSLKHQFIENDVIDLLIEMEEQGQGFVLKHSMLNLSFDGRQHPDPVVKSLSGDVQKKYWKIMEADMSSKYTLQTPLKHITSDEKLMLRTLRRKSTNDANYQPVIFRLYWNLMAQDLDGHMELYAQHPRKYKVLDGYVKKLKFYISAPNVPLPLKNKAKEFINELQNDGKIERPQGGGRGARGRCYRRY